MRWVAQGVHGVLRRVMRVLTVRPRSHSCAAYTIGPSHAFWVLARGRFAGGAAADADFTSRSFHFGGFWLDGGGRWRRISCDGAIGTQIIVTYRARSMRYAMRSQLAARCIRTLARGHTVPTTSVRT